MTPNEVRHLSAGGERLVGKGTGGLLASNRGRKKDNFEFE